MFTSTSREALLGFPAAQQSKQGREMKRDNLSQCERVCMLPCKYPAHFLVSTSFQSRDAFSFHLPLNTAPRCRTTVNRYPPPHCRRGSTLMKLCLGAPVLADYTPGVMISSVAWGLHIWLPQSSSGCFHMLTRPSQFRAAQQVCRLSQLHGAGIETTYTRAHKCVKVFVNADTHTGRGMHSTHKSRCIKCDC